MEDEIKEGQIIVEVECPECEKCEACTPNPYILIAVVVIGIILGLII